MHVDAFKYLVFFLFIIPYDLLFHSLCFDFDLSFLSHAAFSQRVLSALAHWSPIFAEVDYLPALVFPFVRLFEGDDECASFELVAAVLLNWARRWFEFWPHAPVTLLRQVRGVGWRCGWMGGWAW